MTSYTAEQYQSLAERLEPQQYATGIAFSYIELRMVIAALRLAAAAADEPEACIACNVPLVDGDMVHSEASGGCIHAACCGPERESYYGEDGEPLKDGEPIPTPWRWTSDFPAKADADEFDGYGSLAGLIDAANGNARSCHGFSKSLQRIADGETPARDIANEALHMRWDQERVLLPARAAGDVRELGFVKPDNDRQVFFYEQDFYVLSNFSAFSLYWRDCRMTTTEHAYHYEKFVGTIHGHNVAREIYLANSAHDAFKIAERNKAARRPDWDDVKVDIMRDILRAKVAQHEYVRRKLLATGDRELIEDSWRDDFWGWGPNRDGKNILGKLWMEVRAELLAALAHEEIGAAGNDCACGKFSDGLTCPGPDGVPLCVQPSGAGETQSSDGSVDGHAPEGSASVAVRGLRERRPRDMEAAGSQREAETGRSPETARAREQASNCISQDSDRIAGPAAARGRAGIKPGPSEPSAPADEEGLFSQTYPMPIEHYERVARNLTAVWAPGNKGAYTCILAALLKAALPSAPSKHAEAVATLTYTNYRGVTSTRRIIPKSVRYGSTAWHPEPQWLLLAWDDDKQSDREFALKDFGRLAVDADATYKVGRWLSAALDDPAVCAEMKADINAWFAAGQPNVQPAVVVGTIK